MYCVFPSSCALGGKKGGKEWRSEFSPTTEIVKLWYVASRMFLLPRYIRLLRQTSFIHNWNASRFWDRKRKSCLSHITYNSGTMLPRPERYPSGNANGKHKLGRYFIKSLALRMHHTWCYRIEIFQKCNRPCPKKITWKIIGLSSLYTWEIHYLHFPSRMRSLFLVLIITQLACVLTLAKIMLAWTDQFACIPAETYDPY